MANDFLNNYDAFDENGEPRKRETTRESLLNRYAQELRNAQYIVSNAWKMIGVALDKLLPYMGWSREEIEFVQMDAVRENHSINGQHIINDSGLGRFSIRLPLQIEKDSRKLIMNFRIQCVFEAEGGPRWELGMHDSNETTTWHPIEEDMHMADLAGEITRRHLGEVARHGREDGIRAARST